MNGSQDNAGGGDGTSTDAAPSVGSPAGTGPARTPTFADPARASEAGKRSVEARRRRREMSPEERALDVIQRDLDHLVRELVDAALGRGAFGDLKLDTRFAAVKTALEYGLGKPTTASKTDPASEESTGPTPESLFAAPRIDPAAVADKTA